MGRNLLFAIPLFLCISSALPAQQQTNNPADSQPALTQTSTTGPATAAPTAPVAPAQKNETNADLLMARKEYGEAAAVYIDLLKADPKNARLMNMAGVAYQMLDETRRSEHYYKLAMKADKTFSSPLNNLGTLEYGRKHYGKAITLYKRALTSSTDLPTVYCNLGYAYFANKEYPEAMGSFSKAMALDANIFEHKGGYGSIIQQRTATDPGLFYFLVAKAYALTGDAARTAHYLKLSRDDGYKDYASAEKDPAFSKVIKDPAVQEALQVLPSYANDAPKSHTD
jgi:tetratricopeptide (TPR) repeat protein